MPLLARLRHPVAAVVAVGVLAFVVYGLVTPHIGYDMDLLSGDVFAWHLAHTGSPWIDAVTNAQLSPATLSQIWTQQHGAHTVIGRSPGVLAAGVPAYLLQALFGGGGAHLSLTPETYTAAALTCLAVVLLALACRDLLPLPALLVAEAVLAFATPFWTVLSGGVWPHDVTVLGIAGMAWAARRERWWLVGLFGGIGLWGRLHVVLIVAILGLGVALWRRRPSIAVQVAATSVPLLALASLWSRWLYHHWSPSGGYSPTVVGGYATSQSHSDLVVNLLGLLVSPGRGLLVWTPALLALSPAVVRGWRSAPDWTRVLALGGVAYLVVQSAVDVFTGGSGFYGYRLALETLACATPLLLACVPRMGRIERAVLPWLVGLQLAAFSFGAHAGPLYIAGQDGWHTNAFWLALRTQTGSVVPYAVGVTLLVVVLWRVVPVLLQRYAVDDSSEAPRVA